MPLSKYDIEIDLAQRQGTSHAHLVEMVGANKRVLDVGCDTGYLGEALAAFGNHTWGFEVNEVTAAEARKRLEHVVVGDLERVDLIEAFGRASFDVVVFGDVLEHLRDPLPVLRQARGLLAPGGSVVISLPNIAHGDIRLALLQGRFRYTSVGILDETHTKFFTRDSLVEFLRDAGFVLLDLRRTFAPLFGTEANVHEEDFPAEVVDKLRDDPEATTYQFVLRAVPDDAASVESAQALRIDELTSELSALRAARDGSAAAVAAERARFGEAQAAADQLAAERDRAVAERDRLAGAAARIAELTAERDQFAAQVDQLQQAAETWSERAEALEVDRDHARSELAAVNATITMRVARAPRAIYGRLRSH